MKLYHSYDLSLILNPGFIVALSLDLLYLEVADFGCFYLTHSKYP